MITSEQALSYQFQKAGMNGYRSTEVDEFVTSAAETLAFQEKKILEMQRIIEELKKNETVIQTTLVNAQKLAMQLTDEAEQKANDTVSAAEQKAQQSVADADEKAQQTVAAANAEAEQIKAAAEQERASIIAQAQDQSNAMLDEAKRRVEKQDEEFAKQYDKQNKLLDTLRSEVSAFRSDILNRYKAQVTLIKDLPELIKEEPAPAPAEPEPIPAAEEAEDDIPVIEMNVSEPAADHEPEQEPANSDLLKIMNDMAENEAQAAAAVDEVATLTSEQMTFDDGPAPEETAKGGFHIIIDDFDDEKDEPVGLKFSTDK